MVVFRISVVALLLTLPVGAAQESPNTTAATHRSASTSAHKNKKERGIGNWYSLESEILMGKQYAAEIERHTRILQDAVVNEYVNRLGQNLVRNSDAKVPFTIKVIDSDEVNAFALPGGFMYVNTGLILAAEDEAELAGAMAHEIAHVAARHATRQKTRSIMLKVASVPLIFVGGGVGFALQQAAAAAVPLSMMRFSRNFEDEADYLGLEYVDKTGYDPVAFITFLERVQLLEEQSHGILLKAFSSHPPIVEWVKRLQREIENLMPAREDYIITTSKFNDVKARLLLPQRVYGAAYAAEPKPTLKRRATDPDARLEDNGSNAPDGRPTLKRRPQ